jgi:peptide deformylase
MSKLKLLNESSKFLRQSVKEYDLNLYSEKSFLEEVSNDLLNLMYTQGGIGLSANQTGLNFRVFVMGNEERRYICWNPKVLEKSEIQQENIEGCLSFPDLYLKIKRCQYIKVEYYDQFGSVRKHDLVDDWAQCFQHELDHLNGVVFTERVSRLRLRMAKKRRIKVRTQI